MDKQTLVIATGNAGKLKEMVTLLSGLPLKILPQSDFKVPEAIEDGLSFIENALIKARHAAEYTGFPAIADDSGLAVDALAGAPGIYSSRYAGEAGNSAANNVKLLQALVEVPSEQRTARFHCAAVFVQHAKDPAPIVCHATWEGRILEQAVGQGGFGYDPVFYVESQGCTSAELKPDVKNTLSHRGQAIQKLAAQIRTLYCE